MEEPAGVALELRPLRDTSSTSGKREMLGAALPNGVETGWRLLDGEWLAPEIAPAPVDLAGLKAALLVQIDSAAESVRALYITPGSGQAMTYLAKADEAERLMGTQHPDEADPADYPLLSAEVGITGASLADVGAVVLTAYRQWQVIGGAIERARLAAKAAIAAAENAAEARAAALVVWP